MERAPLKQVQTIADEGNTQVDLSQTFIAACWNNVEICESSGVSATTLVPFQS
jgi:hypothetical protein